MPLLLADLSKLSLHEMDRTDARTKMTRRLERGTRYDVKEQLSFLEHAIVVAWKLKRVTARPVDLLEVLARPDLMLPGDVVLDIIDEVRQTPGPQPYQPTSSPRVNNLNIDEAVQYYDTNVRGNEAAIGYAYTRLVYNMREYLINTYRMRIQRGVINIQYQIVMRDVLHGLEKRFPQTAASTTTCASSPTDGFAVLTNMQWFYGPTWGSTIKLCGRGAPRQRQGNDCARWPDLHRRQLELIEVLRRNVVHPSVADVHVVVGEAPPVEALLRRLPWWPTHGCKVRLIATGRRPTFRDYMVQLTTPPLLGRPVVLTNQDIFLAGTGWQRLGALLTPGRALMLSRHHERVAYDPAPTIDAAEACGLFNRSALPRRPAPRSAMQRLWPGATGKGARHAAAAAGTAGTASAASAREAVCDMSTAQYGMWRRSTCYEGNFGAFDAYALRLRAPLSAAELTLFDYPQNAWGGENAFLYLIRQLLRLEVRNPCLTLKVVHAHCELPNSFGPQKVGDRRLGKRDVVEKIQAGLRRLGHTITDDYRAVGSARVNVTRD